MATKKRPTRRSTPRKAARRQRRAVPQDKEIVNADEAALILGISKRLLLKLARQGEIPGKKLGREWRFLRSALRNSLAAGEDDALIRVLEKQGATSKRKKRRDG